MKLDDCLDDDADYVIRDDGLTVKFDAIDWRGGSWVLLKAGQEVGTVIDGAVDGLREVA